MRIKFQSARIPFKAICHVAPWDTFECTRNDKGYVNEKFPFDLTDLAVDMEKRMMLLNAPELRFNGERDLVMYLGSFYDVNDLYLYNVVLKKIRNEYKIYLASDSSLQALSYTKVTGSNVPMEYLEYLLCTSNSRKQMLDQMVIHDVTVTRHNGVTEVSVCTTNYDTVLIFTCDMKTGEVTQNNRVKEKELRPSQLALLKALLIGICNTTILTMVDLGDGLEIVRV